MTSLEKTMMLKAMTNIDYARKKFLEGAGGQKRITWEMLLGDFITYSGIAFKSHLENPLVSGLERTLARQLTAKLYTTRFGWAGQMKAVRLNDLKHIMEGPLGETYPRGIGTSSISYLNRLLKDYGLDPIQSRKLQRGL